MKKYKILLIDQLFWSSPSMGLKYLHAYLKENNISSNIYYPLSGSRLDEEFRVFLSNALIEYKLDSPIFKEVVAIFVKEILRYKFDWLGFNYYFNNTINNICLIEVLKEVKRKRPNISIVLGGHSATFIPDRFLEQFHFIDCVVVGEGEVALKELLLASEEDWHKILGISYRKEGKYFFTGKRPLIVDLDTLPFPVRSRVDKKEIVPICTSRGCYGNCSFCSIKSFYAKCPGPRWRGRSPKNVIKEINFLKMFLKRQDSFFLSFNEDNIMIPGLKGLDRVREICFFLKKNNLFAGFICRANDISIEFMEIIKDVALSLEVGIEAFDDETLKFYGKGYKRSTSIAAMEVLSKYRSMFKKIGIDTILFHPYITLEQLKRELSDYQEYFKDFYLSERPLKSPLMVREGQDLLLKLKREHPELLSLKSNDFLSAEYSYRFLDPRVEKIWNELTSCYYDEVGFCKKTFFKKISSLKCLRKIFLKLTCEKSRMLMNPRQFLNIYQSSWIYNFWLAVLKGFVDFYVQENARNKEHVDFLKERFRCVLKIIYFGIGDYFLFKARLFNGKIVFSVFNKKVKKLCFKNYSKQLSLLKEKGFFIPLRGDLPIPELKHENRGSFDLKVVIFDLTAEKVERKVLKASLLFIFEQKLQPEVEVHIKCNQKEQIFAFDDVISSIKIKKQEKVNIDYYIFWEGSKELFVNVKDGISKNYTYILPMDCIDKDMVVAIGKSNIIVNVKEADLVKNRESNLYGILIQKKMSFYLGIDLCGEYFDLSNLKLTSFSWNSLYNLVKELSKKRLLNNFLNYSSNYKGLPPKAFYCKAGKETIYINSLGEIYPCHKLIGAKDLIGNVMEMDSLNAEKIEEFGDRCIHFLTECSKCWARYVCRGGCGAAEEARGAKASICQSRRNFFKLAVEMDCLDKNI